MNRIDLCGSWTMTGADGARIASEVPGSVLKTLLDNGKIADVGTHDELIRKNGIYKTFVEGRQEAASWKIA